MPIFRRNLRSLFATIAPLGLVTTGCGSSLGEFDQRVCLTESTALASLAPAAGTDFVALRNAMFQGPVSVVATWGEACATASNQAACQSALAQLPLDKPLGSKGIDAITDFDLAVTRGDTVTSVSTRESLLELLGPIDSPSDATLVAFAAGHDLPCDLDNVRKGPDGFVLLGTRGHTCGGDVEHYEVNVTTTGTVTEGPSEIFEHGDPNCAIGRRPFALRSRTGRARSLGQYFANAAHLEAASVHAFAELEGELVAHGAPRSLVRAARRARADEVRHTRATAALARRFGATAARPSVGAPRVRALLDVALDNATEGCVRETFGALVATVQARKARDPQVRAALQRIAADETRHAELSWAIDGWARARLSPREVALLDEARRDAVSTLRGELTHPWPREVSEGAGLPEVEASAALVAALDAALWRSTEGAPATR